MADKQYSLLSMAQNDPGTQSYLSLGKSAMDSGQVSPDEVAQTQEIMSKPGGSKALQSAFSKLGIGKKSESLLPAPLVEMMKAGGSTGKGKQTKADQKMTQDQKTSTTKNLYANPDEFAARMQTVQDLPFIQDQQKSIEQAQNALSMQQAEPSENKDFWVKPLLSLSDAIHGTQMAKDYTPPENRIQKAARLTGVADDLQKRKEALSKMIFEGAKQTKDGTETNASTLALMQQLGRIEGQINSGGRGDPDDRMAFQAHQRTINAIKNDKTLKDRLTQYTNLGNSLAMIDQADITTPNSIDEAQQGIRANLGIKGTGGVDERDRIRMNSVMLEMARLKQQMTGKPQDVSKDNEILIHIKNLANVERENIKQAIQQRLAVASGGNDWLYEDPVYGKKYKPSLDALLGATTSQFGNIPKKGGAAPKAAVVRPAALSKSPKEWTPADQAAVDAYEKSLGG